ncbi:hypothetical protein HUU05_11120 [candidate division KSB1 bacterium]|nr:hypothetical protein [candidate division KSB1 bacterium]
MTSKLFKAALFAVFVICALLLLALSASSQVLTPQSLDCLKCKHVNEWSYKFCVSCGTNLSAAKTAKLDELQREREAAVLAQHKAQEDSLARLREAEQRSRASASQEVRAQVAKRDSVTQKNNGSILAATSARATAPSNGASAKPQSRSKASAQRWYNTLLSEPAVLPRLFNVPTAGVLGSLDLYFTGGGAFGIEKERNFLGRAGLGLGDIAEVEFATQAVINSLQHGSSTVPTSAFKMLVLREHNNLPAVAVSLRGTTSWQYLQGDDYTVSFETRLTKLYIVASKKINTVSGHVGLGLTDVRVRNPQGWNFKNGNSGEMQSNLWAPFAGVSIQANPKAQVMFEIEGLPSYDFVAGESHDRDDIKSIWAGVIGVRFYFTNWLAADTGVRYRSDFDGIADANIQANINMLLPLGRLRNTGKPE